LKRRSAGKQEQLQLEDFILFLDENLDNCQPILDALVANKVQYRRHRDHFERGVLDEVWLSFVAERAWVVLTKDKRNRYNDLERDALRRNLVREFYFGSGNFNGEEMAQALVQALPDLRNICRTFDPPVVGSIARSGVVTVVYDARGSTHERRQASRRPHP
jgi:PIN like domain